MCDYRTILSLFILVLAPLSVRAEVIILRNGGVLSGTVVESNQSYVISLGGRAETSLPRSAVKFICASMYEAYEIQRDQNDPQDADAHIALAQWCVRHDLLDDARAELRAIHASRQGDIRIGVINRKIKLQQDSLKSRNVNAAATDSDTPMVMQTAHVESGRHNADNAVQDHELQQLLATISTHSIARFNKDVQTRMLHGCAASGCHSSESDNLFRLHCESPYRVVPRRMMFQNFANCYQLIDQTNREESKLLKYLVTPHGDQRTPVYRTGSKHYEAIRQWVLTAGETDEKNAASATKFGSQAVSRHDSSTAAGWHEVGDNELSDGLDPFDANVFNRRYGVDRVEDLSADDEKQEKTDTSNEAVSSESASDVQQAVSPVFAPRRLSNETTANAQPVVASENR